MERKENARTRERENRQERGVKRKEREQENAENERTGESVEKRDERKNKRTGEQGRYHNIVSYNECEHTVELHLHEHTY